MLQLLSPSQSSLVPLLGKRSGYEQDYSKRDACREAHYEWIPYVQQGQEEQVDIDINVDVDVDVDVLPQCAYYVQVKLISITPAGDHDACLVEVVQTGKWNDTLNQVVRCKSDDISTPQPQDPSTALYTAQLRKEGLI